MNPSSSFFCDKVGSFARGLFLVHSECLESNYIASRPFRVNAVSFFCLFSSYKLKILFTQNLEFYRDQFMLMSLFQEGRLVTSPS